MNSDTLILLGLIACAIIAMIFTLWRDRVHASESERRMQGMLERIGLDPTEAGGWEDGLWESVVDMSMADVRRRCRSCETVPECESWLAEEQGGDNCFCPNARVFDALKVMRDTPQRRD